jgi:hypothetical protein
MQKLFPEWDTSSKISSSWFSHSLSFTCSVLWLMRKMTGLNVLKSLEVVMNALEYHKLSECHLHYLCTTWSYFSLFVRELAAVSIYMMVDGVSKVYWSQLYTQHSILFPTNFSSTAGSGLVEWDQLCSLLFNHTSCLMQDTDGIHNSWPTNKNGHFTC